MASNAGLYDPSFEHDSCGIGFVANINGNKSHQVISDALTVLENMEHRGACGCENNTGDGAGIMIQTPHDFFVEECLNLGVNLPDYSRYGVGVLFLPAEHHVAEQCRKFFTRCAEQLNLKILAFRKVKNARIPTRLVGIVAMGDDERHFDAGLEEDGEAARPYVAVAEDDRSCCHGSVGLFSRTAWMR